MLWFPVVTRDLALLHCIHTKYGTYPTSNLTITKVSFSRPRVAGPRMLAIHFHLVPRWKMCGATLPLLTCLHGMQKESLTSLYLLQCILPVSKIILQLWINRQCLKPAPSEGDDQWVACLQNLLIPTMFLNTHLQDTYIGVCQIWLYYGTSFKTDQQSQHTCTKPTFSSPASSPPRTKG